MQVVYLLRQLGGRARHHQIGTTCVMARGRTRAGLTPSPASQPPSCRDEVAYTMRPSPAQPWAAAHMGQCSPEV